MSCKGFGELIDGFLDNQLEEYEADLLQHHFKVCRRCKERLRRSISLTAMIKSEIARAEGPRPGEGFARKIISSLGRTDQVPPSGRKQLPSILTGLREGIGKPLVVASLAAAAALVLVISFILASSFQDQRLLTVYELAKEQNTVMASADNGIDHLLNEHIFRYRQSSLVIDRVMNERTMAAK